MQTNISAVWYSAVVSIVRVPGSTQEAGGDVRQDIGSESDRRRSIQHSTFLAISTIHCILGNKNYVRLLLGSLKKEDTGVIGKMI